MTTSLVTGGAGFIGSHIVNALLDRGDVVRVLDNLSVGRMENLQGSIDQIEFIKGDIRDPESIKRALKGVDLVFHLAAFVSVPLSLEKPNSCFEINVYGTQQILEFSRLADVKRVVIASSAAVYGEVPDLPLKENGRTDPLSPYASSKYITEILTRMYTRQLGLDVVALRFFNVFGPRQNPESDYAAVIPIFIKNLIAGEKPIIYGDGKQSRDFIYVADVVKANLLAGDINAASGQVINICSGQEIQILDLIRTLSGIFNQDIESIFEHPRAGDIYRSLGDPSLANELLGFHTETSMKSGLEATVKWLRGSSNN